MLSQVVLSVIISAFVVATTVAAVIGITFAMRKKASCSTLEDGESVIAHNRNNVDPVVNQRDLSAGEDFGFVPGQKADQQQQAQQQVQREPAYQQVAYQQV